MRFQPNQKQKHRFAQKPFLPLEDEMVGEVPSLLPSRGVVMVRGYWIVSGARSEERGARSKRIVLLATLHLPLTLNSTL